MSPVIKIYSFGVVMVLGMVFSPFLAEAQNLAGAAQCTGTTCSACNLIYLANAIIKWLIGFLCVLFAVLMAIAGWGLVVSGGNQSALEAAKEKFTNAIIGFLIVLSAWLVVDTIMRGLVQPGGVIDGDASGALFWSQVECQAQFGVSTSTNPISLDDIETYLDGTSISESGMQIGGISGPVPNQSEVTGNLASYAGHRFDSGIISNVRYVAENFNLRVSGGHRTPERNRQVNGVSNSRHLTGRAADFVGTSADMNRALNWARSNGARGLIHDAGNGTHLHLEW